MSEIPPPPTGAPISTGTPVGTNPAAAPAVTPQRSALPIVGISLAGLAFLLAFAAAGIAWLPAIAAIVLGIIGLVKKSEPKILSILALAIGPVAWLIAIVVAIASLASLGAGLRAGIADAPVTEQSDSSEDSREEPPEEPEPVADGSSLNSPLPFGTVVAVDSWTGKYDVSFGPANWDATAEVKAENMFNSDPGDGMKYILIPITMTNTDDEEWNPGATFFWGDIKLVSDGRGFSEGALVVVPNGLLDQGDLYPGGSVTGNVVFEVPIATASGVWDVDGVFVSAQE